MRTFRPAALQHVRIRAEQNVAEPKPAAGLAGEHFVKAELRLTTRFDVAPRERIDAPAVGTQVCTGGGEVVRWHRHPRIGRRWQPVVQEPRHENLQVARAGVKRLVGFP